MIAIQNASLSYKGKQAVDSLSLTVAGGEIYGLLGPNGAGKSTTMNMLLGFLKPDSGKTIIAGINTSEQAGTSRKHIGYIPENVNLYPYLSGIENLDYFCKIANLHYSRQELSGFLTKCGLREEALNRRTETYSKGMRQKVGIAIAYAKKASAYLLDEPASGLDPLASNELSLLLKKLADEGAAILMASHDIFRVRETCHRIGILKHGVLVNEMHTSAVTANELEKIYLNYMQD
ncbi:ABC transporter ATP-binding protein [Gynurincola endophyticus]|jgi:ABC-2 type transport system ATP-binding protein|uniref:ABC transporter ATP-binding protein n=1 Tax=Gynurincola endophyticus TaxID=2479004 RepID=UPI000F8DEB9D|nr:ABC transporter ATP-binding protein [Gynurincola endophyticus]